MNTNTSTDTTTDVGASRRTEPISGREYDVPADAPAHECPYCDAVLPEDDLLDLHVGVEHEDEATEVEVEAFEDAFERESNHVFIYHLKVIVLVVAIYFIFLFTYSAVV